MVFQELSTWINTPQLAGDTVVIKMSGHGENLHCDVELCVHKNGLISGHDLSSAGLKCMYLVCWIPIWSAPATLLCPAKHPWSHTTDKASQCWGGFCWLHCTSLHCRSGPHMPRPWARCQQLQHLGSKRTHLTSTSTTSTVSGTSSPSKVALTKVG